MGSATIKVAVSCTDQGQHGWTALGDLILSSGLLRANNGAVYGEIAERRKDECVWLDHLDPGAPVYRVNMRCPRCHQHVEWKHDTAVGVLTKLDAAGISSIDISKIPS